MYTDLFTFASIIVILPSMQMVKASKPKQRILEASAALFYKHDANTIGVDKVCEVADVSKRTLYKHFSTKEVLVSEALAAQADTWAKDFAAIKTKDPAGRIVSVFKILEQKVGSKDYHGCPMMNTSIELRDSSAPAKNVAKDFKAKLLEYFEHQATLLNVNNPGSLAEQLLLLYDGCNAWIVMRRQFPKSVFKAVNVLLRNR